MCRQVEGTQHEMQHRAVGLTSDQRRAALFASGQLTPSDDDALGW
ncbi:hypothetical protein DB30_00809 [Enhygromyxa salina]|uniref:Uncharacterized protein n=1 Tax=Enhygromyxa salina TaxID=215803 RepID=A0A0C2CTT6_9BACT|nr:hypothetical protein DB30_00809 [Enhygromyxa salina]